MYIISLVQVILLELSLTMLSQIQNITSDNVSVNDKTMHLLAKKMKTNDNIVWNAKAGCSQ